MRLTDFQYDLPEELIAQQPLTDRAASRLLAVPAEGDRLLDLQFRDLPGLLHPGDLLVFNDTRVIPARLYGRKASGGKVEMLVERLLAPNRALAHLRSSHSPKPGAMLEVGRFRLLVTGRQDDLFELESQGCELAEILEAEGHMPLPPYIRRADAELDRDRYQTVYAERPGAVAAPTAGLHFDQPMLERLMGQGIRFARVTLHVGAGTFQPVRVDDLGQHRMHAEWVEVDQQVCDQIRHTRESGGRIIAVGTTAVRALESAAASGALRPFQGDTRLFITPGYRFRVVDALLTNFHLPGSTLLMLVAAFAGYSRVMAAYAHAVRERYRFFSYGDAMFLLRAGEGPAAGG